VHASEIQYVFGNLRTSVEPSRPEEVLLSRNMQAAWVRFAKNPIGGPGWGRVEGLPSRSLGEFTQNGSLIATSPASADRNCGLFEPLLVARAELEAKNVTNTAWSKI